MPINPENRPVVYTNGLGSGKTRLHVVYGFKKLTEHGFSPEHLAMDWRKDQDLDTVINRRAKHVLDLLLVAPKVWLIGESAGGSLQLNILKRLLEDGVDPSKLQVVTHASWYQGGLDEDTEWTHRTLAEAAHLGTKNASQLFYDSVERCQTETLPYFTKDHLASITRRVARWGDRIVPQAAQESPQAQRPIETVPINAVGHSMACIVGMLTVDQYLE